jgi:hypothetical protein
MRRSLLIGAVLLASIACKKDKPVEATAAEVAEPEARPPNKRVQPAVKNVVTAITVDEVKPLLGDLPGAKQVKEPAKAAHGERVEVQYCFAQGELLSIGDTVKSSLTGSGWHGVALRANPKVADRMNLGARREPFMLTGRVERGAFPDCEGENGKTLVTLYIHKQTPRPIGATAPMPVGPRGTTNLRPLGGPRPLTGEPRIVTPPVSPQAPAPAPATP